jgi:phenylalanine-4-hydroxylase
MKTTAKDLPFHLRKYIVEQDYEQYTPVDQACWRYVLRQLKNFLSQHAHESYLEGLEKTGIEIERIPKIEEISSKLEKFGWRALPVSGFIPPAAFMELQSLGVLPIASAMRSLEHLTYTPAPDIVHEAAGHAPILIQPEFAQYLRNYAQVARKALLSSEDLELYEAIRLLSDLKENPNSTAKEIEDAQTGLEKTVQKISFVSEASLLGRMNWWTAEYGLIGDLENPKIFGAGLLSSVEESKWCLSDRVKKIPLSLKCLETNYDITEPQPQLFVTPNFKTMTTVLNEMAETMAFRQGELPSVKKAIQAKTVNTVELDSGVQISGRCCEVITASDLKTIVYLKFEGPTQLSYKEKEISGQGKTYHSSGYGTALGPLKSQSWSSVIGKKGSPVSFEFASGVQVQGVLKNHLEKDGKPLLLTFENCTVAYKDQKLFEPAWGLYDLALGEKVTSVFGGPADRETYGDTDDFVARRVPKRQITASQKELYHQYQKVRDLREQKISGIELEKNLEPLLATQEQKFPEDWLLLLESYELLLHRASKGSSLTEKVLSKLRKFQSQHPEQKSVIEDGLFLAPQI